MAPPRTTRNSRQVKTSASKNKRKSKSVQRNPSKKPRVSSSPAPPPKAGIVSSVTPNKSPKDPNEYRVIQLSTGLTVVLISRKGPAPDTKDTRSSSGFLRDICSEMWPFQNAYKPECHFIEPVVFPLGCTTGGPSAIPQPNIPKNHSHTSVALVVNVGGLNDSPDRQGLAHFTEHMVHYGSKKFPNEDAINAVVNFGTYNAVTRQHTTNYYNEVPDLVLDENLAMFAEMLTHPLFKAEMLNREVNAVDNEFYLRLPLRQKLLLMSHVSIKETAHPLKRCLCGSLDTLGKGTEGAQVQREMKDYHQKNYVASAMTLSINSTKSLDDLEELTLRHFSNFLQGDRSTYIKTPDGKIPSLILQGNQHVFLQGLSSRSELSMVWFLPASLSTDELQDRTMPLILRLLSDTSSVSLDNYLRNEELIWSMYVMPNSTRYATVLIIEFELTEKGKQNVYQIVEATFNFIRVLRNASEQEMKRVFEEMRVQNLKEYHYGNQKATLETTNELAMRLQYIDQVSKVISCESWMDSRFNFKAVQKVLTLLESEDTTLIETLSRKDGYKLAQKGHVKTVVHTKAKYVVNSWNKDMYLGSRRNAASRNGSGDGATNFGFIPENKYLVSDLAVMATMNVPGSVKLNCPGNCGDIAAKNLTWNRENNSGQTDSIPKIVGIHRGHKTFSHDPFNSGIRVRFISSVDRIFNRRNRALSWLWGFTIPHRAAPYWSEFINAGFHVAIRPGYPLTLSIEGFPRHMEDAMNTLISCVFEKPVTPREFSLAKQQLSTLWEEYLGDSGIVSDTLLKCTIFENADLSIDFLGILKELTFHDLKIYIKAFCQSAFASVELIGNIPVEKFTLVASHLEKMPFAPIIGNDPSLYAASYLSFKPEFYTPDETCVRIKALNNSAYTTSVTNSYVLGPYGTNAWLDDLFSAAIFFMQFKAFMDLRTRQQLGYVVYVRKHIHQVKYPMMMFSITVVATARKFTMCELDQKIDQFLAEYGDAVRSLPPDVFQTMLELTYASDIVTQDNVADWFESRFKTDFGKVDIQGKCLRAGIKKLSIQILSDNEEAQTKACDCQICSSIKDWKSGDSFGSGSQFQFAVGSGLTKKYFVSSFN